MSNPLEEKPNTEQLSENLVRIKERLLEESALEDTIEGFKVENVYDTGREPETGTKRTEEEILKLTGADGTVHWAKRAYSYRLGNVHDVTFMTEKEANDFIKEEIEYYRPYWDEIKAFMKKSDEEREKS